MKTLIIYTTKYGSVDLCAEALAERLDGEVESRNLTHGQTADPTAYEQVILAGSIYVGKIQKEIRAFCEKHHEVLREKRLGFFICCMQKGVEAEKQLNDSFPYELLDRAVATGCFGGAFQFGKMNFLERMIIRKIAKTDKDISMISLECIDEFAQAMNEQHDE